MKDHEKLFVKLLDHYKELDECRPLPEQTAAYLKNAETEEGVSNDEKWSFINKGKNYPDTMYELACYYEDMQQYDDALKYYELAAEHQHVDAMNRAGRMNFRMEKYVEAIKWYKKAADLGNAEGMHNYACMFQNLGGGWEITEWDEEEFYWELQAAERGCPEAMFNLSMIYYQLYDDGDNGLKWLIKAAEHGYEEAVIMLGTGDEDDPSLSLEDLIMWKKKAASLGSERAMSELAEYYKESGNYDEAIKWGKEAIEAGSSHAYYTLIDIYKEMGNVPEAIRWGRAAAEKDLEEAMFILSDIYSAIGDPANALIWRERGLDKKRRFLKKMLRCTRPDSSSLIRYGREAIELGDNCSMYMIAEEFLKMNNTEETMKWMKIAAGWGNADAIKYLSDINALLE